MTLAAEPAILARRRTAAAPTRDDLLARAAALLPNLHARAAMADDLRRLPDETQAELVQAQLYDIYLPARYGGFELDYMLHVDLAAELGRACGATAWVFAVVASHSWMHGMFDPRCQDEVWADNPRALISGATPTGEAKVDAVEGGFVLNGRWTFASGIDVCDWTHFNMMTPRIGGAGMEHRYGTAPKAMFEVIDDWHPVGLRGTGSKSIRCRDLFIPEYRTIRSEQCRGEPTRGSVANPHPIYRLPLFALFGKGIVGPGIGVARGALELVAAQMRGDRRTSSGIKLAEQPTAQIRAAEAGAEIDAAWALLRQDCDEATRWAERGTVPPLADRMKWRRDDAFAGRLLVNAVDRLLPLAGGGGLNEKNPMLRYWRDMHAVAAHIALAWDAQGVNAGRIAFDLPSLDPKI